MNINNLTQVGDTDVVELKPTIDQLAADYRTKLEIARQAQEEADSHRCVADAALEKLVAAGKALGLIIGIVKDDPVKSELNITDWRDLHADDVIWLDHGVTRPSGEYEIKEIEKHEETCRAAVMWNHVPWWADLDKIDWRFIRRP